MCKQPVCTPRNIFLVGKDYRTIGDGIERRVELQCAVLDAIIRGSTHTRYLSRKRERNVNDYIISVISIKNLLETYW